MDDLEKMAKRSQIYNSGVAKNYQHLVRVLLKHCMEDSVKDLEYYMTKQLTFTEMLEEVAEALYNNPMKHSLQEVYTV